MAHTPETSPAADRWTRAPSDRTDRLLSSAAGLVAVSALVVSVYQTYITRQQQKMSAWPYVSQGNTGGDSTYGRLVSNVGLGPALVRAMSVEVDGREVTTWREVRRAVLRGDSARADSLIDRSRGSTSSVRRGMVLLPGSTTELVRIVGPASLEVRRILTDPRVRIRVCYCSLYGDCWLSDSGEREPAAVPACPEPAGAEFQS